MTLTDQIRAALASGKIHDAGHPLTGRGHGPRCTSAFSAHLADAGVRHERTSSGGTPSRVFPAEVIAQLEAELGCRLASGRLRHLGRAGFHPSRN